MKIAVYPGSFDPITKGHTDVIARAAGLFDELIIAVSENPNKSPMFTAAERVLLIEESVKHIESGNCKIRVMSHDGLLVDFVRHCKAAFIVKGLRAISDFESEFQMASANQKLAPELDSVFIMTRVEYMYLSSSMVKEIAKYQGDISALVGPHVVEAMDEKFNRGMIL